MDYGDEESVKRRSTKVSLEEERIEEALKKFLSSYDGRAALWAILSYCKIYNSPSDSEYILREIGKQDVGRYILGLMFRAEPNAYTLMRQEASNREEKING